MNLILTALILQIILIYHHMLIFMFFSCKEAALEVQIQVCESLSLSV